MGGRGVWVRGVKEEQRSAIAAATAGQCGSVHGSAATAGGGREDGRKGETLSKQMKTTPKKKGGGRERRKRKQNQKESQPANVNAPATCQVKVLML